MAMVALTNEIDLLQTLMRLYARWIRDTKTVYAVPIWADDFDLCLALQPANIVSVVKLRPEARRHGYVLFISNQIGE